MMGEMAFGGLMMVRPVREGEEFCGHDANMGKQCAIEALKTAV